ncbi:MAG TPA: transcriptional repressor [Clostridiales bacterium]|nr:transcriptional repressor [Clostridiales bacterium]
MKTSFEALKQQLKMKNISLSHQRVKVLEYLARNRCHPTADQIFTELQKDLPTLSKTTVYNTLKILTEAGVVRAISIEDNEIRYDIEIEDHGHFKCEVCGTIYNFCIDIDSSALHDLNNFKITDKNVYFKGVCPRCLTNIN